MHLKNFGISTQMIVTKCIFIFMQLALLVNHGQQMVYWAVLGCCQIIQERPNTPSRSYLTGTYAYRAPELLKGESPTFKADVFSLGICLWQFWTREIPYKLQNHQIVIFRVVACNLRPEIPEGNDVDNRYRELMTSSWNGNPEERPSMTEVVNLLKCLIP